jgi:hypothetical protein
VPNAQYHRERGWQPPFFSNRGAIDNVIVIAARCKTLPANYDVATGEKLAPSSKDNAA